MTSSDAAGPSRARSSRGEATARRLREAARTVFGRAGYASARVEDIVAQAGVSHGTFYTYYENKAAVLDALLDETTGALQEVASEPWEGPDVAATVARVIGRFVDVFAAEADVIAVWRQASAHDPHFRARLQEVRRGYIDRVADQLDPVVRDDGHDPRVAARALVAMVEGFTAVGLGTGPEPVDAGAVATLSAIWVGGIERLAGPEA